MMARGSVMLGVDLGELPGEPEELYRIATLVHVACGGHAGDEASMRRAVALASASGALLAAHPSYPDRAGFGRRTTAIAADALRDAIALQCAALRDVAGGGVRAVKLHGALYHDAARDPAIARAVVEGVERGLPGAAVIWIGPARGALRERVLAAGGVSWREGFADRGAQPDGSLIPRGRPGALIEEPERAAAQALALARSGEVDTLCVHSDTPGAVEIARAVRRALEGAGLLAGAGVVPGAAGAGPAGAG